MAVQQRKVSKTRARRRKAANRYGGLQPTQCAACGAACRPHRICPSCGVYKGKQVLSVTSE